MNAVCCWPSTSSHWVRFVKCSMRNSARFLCSRTCSQSIDKRPVGTRIITTASMIEDESRKKALKGPSFKSRAIENVKSYEIKWATNSIKSWMRQQPCCSAGSVSLELQIVQIIAVSYVWSINEVSRSYNVSESLKDNLSWILDMCLTAVGLVLNLNSILILSLLQW